MTDANLVLGRLDAGRPLAGGVELDEAAARSAVGALGAELGLDARACAEGILRVANAEMVRALRVMTVERGIDPRGFALLAFGGAGPLHACAIAEELGIRRIVVPRAGGVLSALGLAAADRRRDTARTVLLRGDAITEQALGELAAGADDVAWDVRYAGQSFELTLRDVEPEPRALRAAFDDAHEDRYGYADVDAPIELVTVRRTQREPGPDVDLRAQPGPQTITGPRVLALPETTVVVAEGWAGGEDAAGTIRLERTA